MLTSSSSQFIHPDYLQPLPTTVRHFVNSFYCFIVDILFYISSFYFFNLYEKAVLILTCYSVTGPLTRYQHRSIQMSANTLVLKFYPVTCSLKRSVA